MGWASMGCPPTPPHGAPNESSLRARARRHPRRRSPARDGPPYRPHAAARARVVFLAPTLAQSMSMLMIRLEGVELGASDARVLDHVSLGVAGGEIVVV